MNNSTTAGTADTADTRVTRRGRPRVLGLALCAIMTIAASGCTADEAGDVDAADHDATPPAASSSDTAAPRTAAAAQSCTNDAAGFTVDYPGDWHTNDGSVMPACSLFDPDPFTVPIASEIPEDIAAVITRQQVGFDIAAGDDFGRRVLSRDTTEVDGRTAIRMESESTGEGLHDAGLVTYSYIVDLDGETLFAESHAAGEPAFEAKKRALDLMMQSLRIIR